MPTRSQSERVTLAALALSLLLVADVLVVRLSPAARAAEDAGRGAESTIGAEAVLGDGPDAAFVCTAGFGDRHTRADMSLHGVTLTGGGALAVGFARRGRALEEGRRRPAALVNLSGRWNRINTSSPGREDGLVAVTAGRGKEVWAVGFMTTQGNVMPLAMRWNGTDWKVDRPPPRGAMASMLTDVTILSGGEPFVVGYRMTPSGQRRPIAARKQGRSWRYYDPGFGASESISLTGIAPDGRGGLWVVGHGGSGAEIGPIVYRRDRARWQRMKVPSLPGEAVLADVVATSGDDAWAIGYQRRERGSTPLVLHWDGKAWRRKIAPAFDSHDVILTAASVAPTGGIWVVGAAWNAEVRSHEAVAAWWDGQAWDEVVGADGGTELHDVVGSLDADGWAVGRDGQQASTTRVCTPPQAGIFGGSEPNEPLPPVDTIDGVTVSSPADRRTDADDEAEALDPDALDAEGIDPGQPGAPGGDQPGTSEGEQVTTAESDAAVATERTGEAAERDTERTDKPTESAASGKTVVARKQRRPRRNRSSRSRGPAPLPAAVPNRKLVARDVARPVGIAETIGTYGAVVSDFDGDGIDDLYIGRHGRPGRLLLNRDGRFVDHEPMVFPPIDRHGCAAADIDGSGLPDLYCAVGGKRGSGLKSNELWIDPGGPAPYDVAAESGLSDPTGRGRSAVFLEARQEDDISLVVTNSPTRVDGLPSIGRFYRTLGDRQFDARARTGFASRLGSLTIQDADFDGDGREDLLLVTGGAQAPARQGTRLYRNTKRGLVDVTSQLGIRSFGEIDAELVDLDGDRRLDLVQLSPTRLRASVFKDGRFRLAYDRSLSHGRAIAGGDVNADGRDDLYIVRSNGDRNSADVMLINRKNGRYFSSMTIPQTFAGDGDDVVAIDHDGNHRDDFVVLNGRNARGPIQLIALFKR